MKKLIPILFIISMASVHADVLSFPANPEVERIFEELSMGEILNLFHVKKRSEGPISGITNRPIDECLEYDPRSYTCFKYIF